MNKQTAPRLFAYLGLSLIGLVFAYFATAVTNAGVAARILDRSGAGDLLTSGSAALLVGVAVFAVFGYLALKLWWTSRRRS